MDAFSDGSSTLPASTTSEQALYRLLRLFYKSQSARLPLLLRSKSNPFAGLRFGFGCSPENGSIYHVVMLQKRARRTPAVCLALVHIIPRLLRYINTVYQANWKATDTRCFFRLFCFGKIGVKIYFCVYRRDLQKISERLFQKVQRLFKKSLAIHSDLFIFLM